MRHHFSTILALFLLLGSCSKTDRALCPDRQPAFHLQITAPDGKLPQGTSLSISYGGAESVSYNLLTGSTDTDVLCCAPGPYSDSGFTRPTCTATLTPQDAAGSRGNGAAASPGTPDAGDTTDGIEAIYCELWSNGAAEVEVYAAGYPPLKETLHAQLSEDRELRHCAALETLEVHHALARPDAGINE